MAEEGGNQRRELLQGLKRTLATLRAVKGEQTDVGNGSRNEHVERDSGVERGTGYQLDKGKEYSAGESGGV